MTLYIGQRVLRAAILMLAVSAVSFGLFEAAPGNYFDEFRAEPGVSSETLAKRSQQHGLNDHVVARYFGWLASVLRGDWGYSVSYNIPAGPLLFSRARNTLILTGTAAICAWAIALPFALWTVSGGRVRRWFANSATVVLFSTPDLLIILVLLGASAYWGLFPAGGMTSLNRSGLGVGSAIVDLIRHLIVPGAALVLASLPALILHMRSALIEVLQSPYIKFAQANGISPRRRLLRHALPAAASPLITLMGFSIGMLLSSSLLVETITGWPGLGQLLLQALLQRDLLVVAGAVVLSSVFLAAGSLLSDVLLYAVDPRIRGRR